MAVIKNKIEKKLNTPDLLNKLVNELSNSELNSFCLELFREQSRNIKPAQILRQFEENRFVLPSGVDIIDYKETEIKWLKYAKAKGFKPILLSPLTPLGTCSSVGLVNQNNIVSAARTSEVVSDASNVLALQTAKDFRTDNSKRIVKYCTTHRHTRAQYFDNPAYSAHFGAFCMVSGGQDLGGFTFEIKQLDEHLRFYLHLLLEEFRNYLILRIYFRNENEEFKKKIFDSLEDLHDRVHIIDYSDYDNNYYETVRIKIFMSYKDQEIDLADMGFVNWTQKLLNNKKQRLLISGAGLELIYKIKSSLI